MRSESIPLFPNEHLKVGSRGRTKRSPGGPKSVVPTTKHDHERRREGRHANETRAVPVAQKNASPANNPALTTRELGAYRRARALQYLWEEGLARSIDILAHVFGSALRSADRDSLRWRHHYRLLQGLLRRGWARAASHRILPPRTQLWVLTRAGLTELSRLVNITHWNLPIPRDPRSSASLAHHLRVLDVRPQLEHRYRWIPRRILSVHMAQAKAPKIPDGMLVTPLAQRHDYWGFRLHTSVETELHWKGPDQRVADVARMAAGLGTWYARILLLTETPALAAEWRKTINAAANQTVDVSIYGERKTVHVPQWIPQYIDILPIDQANAWTPPATFVYLPGRVFEDWWTLRSHWGVLEKSFGLQEDDA
jgi:hypothetical protein